MGSNNDEITITLDASNIQIGLDEFLRRANAAVKMFADTNSKTLEKDAKEQAKWTDRTGRARQGLNGRVDTLEDGYAIVLAYNVDYGLWLELAHEKNFAIIEPIVRLSSPFIIKDLQGLFDKINS